MRRATAYTDGGVRASGGDRGPYGCAVVLYWDAGVGHEEAVYLGDHGTVNEAEYEKFAAMVAKRRQI